MPLNGILAALQTDIGECDGLIATAHRQDAAGAFIFEERQRQQITTAAFLNMFIAWETFLEQSFAHFLVGHPSISLRYPVRRAAPATINAAHDMIIGTMKYFDYGNHDLMIKMARIYFANGHPFEPHLTSMSARLAELRTMRNAAAHVTTTTQTKLDNLALNLLGTPARSIPLYTLLMSSRPGGLSVFAQYRDELLAAASLIANG